MQDCFVRFDRLLNLDRPILTIIEGELARQQIERGFASIKLSDRYDILNWLREGIYQPNELYLRLKPRFDGVGRKLD